MSTNPADHTWFGNPAANAAPPKPEDSPEFVRLWHAFMASRLALGLTLVVLQGALYATGTGYNFELVVVSAGYFAITIVTRLIAKPRPLGGSFNRRWAGLVGADVLAILVLQHLQGSSINYTPLFALPILLASVLGNLRLALGTAAGVTVLLLSGTLWGYLGNQIDATPYYVQAALSGVGYFAIALLASQLSTRLASEGQRAHMSQVAARIQQQVNELVIESLPDGVMIVDDKGGVRGANPAARRAAGLVQRANRALVSSERRSGLAAPAQYHPHQHWHGPAAGGRCDHPQRQPGRPAHACTHPAGSTPRHGRRQPVCAVSTRPARARSPHAHREAGQHGAHVYRGGA